MLQAIHTTDKSQVLAILTHFAGTIWDLRKMFTFATNLKSKLINQATLQI